MIILNKKANYKIINLFLIIIITIIVSVFSLSIQDDRIVVKLEDCIDGDTASFEIYNNIKTVRFLAIDTPESVHPTKGIEPYGIEASKYTCNELKSAKVIEIEFDINSESFDKYNRLLAWIFVDSKLLQSKLVSMGYAKVAYLYGDYKYTSILLDEEEVAKQKRIGIWYNNKE
jgi:micrococcal nuclease